MTALATPIVSRPVRLPRTLPVIATCIGLVALLLVSRQAAALRWIVPVLGPVAALVIYRRAGFAVYASFTWWFWFLAPGLRRIVDYQVAGWDPQNPISLAPLLVASVAIVPVVRHFAALRQARAWPWIAALVCLLFGYVTGVLRNGIPAATYSLMSWGVPLLFGLATALEWRHYPALAKQSRTTFIVGGLLLSLYAVLQFFNPPIWDQLWVEGSGMTSAGIAFPYRLRVFSLMNGPLLFAVATLATIFLALAARGALRLIALLAATVALMLTLVRSVWLITIPGALVYLYALPLRSIRRAGAVLIATVALLWGLVVLLPDEVGTPVVSIIQDRAFTIGSLGQDLSYSERTSFMDQISGVVLDSPLGHGLGSTGVSSTLGDPTSGIKDFDSGIFAVLYSLGWFAGAGLLGIAAWVVLAGMPRREARGDLTAKAARAIVFAMFLLNAGGNVFEGFAGMLFWGFAGLLVAAHHWRAATVNGPVRRSIRP